MATFVGSVATCRHRFGLQCFRVQSLSNLPIPKLKEANGKNKHKNLQQGLRLEGDNVVIHSSQKHRNAPYKASESRSKIRDLNLNLNLNLTLL